MRLLALEKQDLALPGPLRDADLRKGLEALLTDALEKVDARELFDGSHATSLVETGRAGKKPGHRADTRLPAPGLPALPSLAILSS